MGEDRVAEGVDKMKWVYSFNGESYSDVYDAREEAIIDALKDVKEYKKDIDTIYLGIAKIFEARVSEAGIIEQLKEDAYDGYGEYSEEYLEDLTDEERSDLQKLLQEAYKKWENKYPWYKPNFYKVIFNEVFAVDDLIKERNAYD